MTPTTGATQQPEALRIAAALEAFCMGVAADTVRRQHAEIETLRAGYAAARLEIESLRASPSGIQWQCGPQANGVTAPAGEYPPLPPPDTHCFDDDTGTDVWSYSADQMRAYVDADRAARAPADSVTEPAGAGVAHALSDGQIEAMPVWRNFVGLWPESRREIVDAVVDLLTTPPTQAADSVLEDTARLDWLLLHISGAEFRRIGVHYSGNASRADVDAARKQGANHD